MNSWIATGEVVQVPMKRQAGNSTVLTLNVCVKDSWKDKASGQVREKKFFIDVKVWGDRGDVLYERIQCGDRVMVVGQLETESWDDKKTGEKRYKTVVRAGDVDVLGGAVAAPKATAAEPENLYETGDDGSNPPF